MERGREGGGGWERGREGEVEKVGKEVDVDRRREKGEEKSKGWRRREREGKGGREERKNYTFILSS